MDNSIPDGKVPVSAGSAEYARCEVPRKAKKAKKSKAAKKSRRAGKSTAKNKTAGTRKRTQSSRKTKQPRRKQTRRLSAKQIEHFRQMLLDKYIEIVGDVDYMENGALRKSRLDASGDLSSMPIHMADIGTDNYEQEFALGLMDSERKILHEIADALKRIEEGRYGICEGTGNPIPKARLEATPWARYCVEYARMLEQGLVSEPSSREEDDEEEEEIDAEFEEDLDEEPADEEDKNDEEGEDEELEEEYEDEPDYEEEPK